MAIPLRDRLARQAAGTTPMNFDLTGQDEPRLLQLPLSAIEPDPQQPRKDLGNLADLALSIREQGLLCPIVVEPQAPGRYRILAGERRYTACRGLGWETMPCIVRTVAEQSRLALQLIENLPRKDLNPVEIARSYQRLMREFNLDQSTLARKLGVSRSSINETLRILDLNSENLEAAETSEALSKSVLIEIAKEPDPQAQRAMLEQAQAGQTSVRQLRQAKRGSRSNTDSPPAITIELEDATVVVRYQTGSVTTERLRGSLTAAMALQGAAPAHNENPVVGSDRQFHSRALDRNADPGTKI